jgi:hypothetical protein
LVFGIRIAKARIILPNATAGFKGSGQGLANVINRTLVVVTLSQSNANPTDTQEDQVTNHPNSQIHHILVLQSIVLSPLSQPYYSSSRRGTFSDSSTRLKRAISNDPLSELYKMTDREMTIDSEDERVIDNWARTEVSWPSNLEMGWGIWLGDDKIWFWGRQKMTVIICEQVGVWCRLGVATCGVGSITPLSRE